MSKGKEEVQDDDNISCLDDLVNGGATNVENTGEGANKRNKVVSLAWKRFT